MQRFLDWVVCSFSLFGLACQPPPITEPDCSAPGADPVECATGPFCGGIAGKACPGLGVCVDNPNDTCDVSHGGRDCGGSCACTAMAKCAVGNRFDRSPSVCSCVPDTEALCAALTCPAGSNCVVVDGRALCEPAVDPCAAVRCVAGHVCQIVQGAASCVPTRDPCANFFCQNGYRCVAPNDVPTCVAAGEQCGNVVCAAGTECCNRSCGICVLPGGVCLQMACVD